MGMPDLVDTLCQAAQSLLPLPGDYALSQRQRTALSRAALSIREAAEVDDEILIGECLRLAMGALDELTGRATTDAVLDELFSGFCIGK
jgi:tRNA modification GTPase